MTGFDVGAIPRSCFDTMKPMQRHCSRRVGLALLGFAAAFAGRVHAAQGAGLAWEIVNPPRPRLFWADRNRDMVVRLRNAGTETWSEKVGDHLSYHWLDRAGTVVEQDGMRTSFPHPVAPGETIEVEARVHAPARSGRWVLEWGMVREQVSWYGPPLTGASTRFPVWVMRRCSLLQIGFLALTVGAVFLSRRAGAAAARWWIAVEAGPVAWTWLATLLVTVTFSELAGVQLWRGGGTLAASAAALVALPVAIFPGRWRAWAGGVIAVAVTLVAFADLLYLRFFGTVVPLVAVFAVGQLGRIEGSVTALMRSVDVWLIPTVASAGVLAALWPRRPRSERARRWQAVAPSLIATLACLVAGAPAMNALSKGLHDPATAE